MTKNPFKQMDVKLTNWRAEYIERCTFGSEEGNVKPLLVARKGVCSLSYNPAPSTEDLELSKRLKESFKILGIDLLDSVIIGKDGHYSMKEAGTL